MPAKIMKSRMARAMAQAENILIKLTCFRVLGILNTMPINIVTGHELANDPPMSEIDII
jgi:hypothetical protein